MLHLEELCQPPPKKLQNCRQGQIGATIASLSRTGEGQLSANNSTRAAVSHI